MEKWIEVIADWPADIIILQETHADGAIQQRCARRLQALGWDIAWGTPVQTVRAKFMDHELSHVAAAGGVAIMVRTGVSWRPVEWGKGRTPHLWRQNGRVVAIEIAIGRRNRRMAIVSYYGISGARKNHKTEAKKANDAAIGAIIAELQGAGESPPVVFAGDLNDDPSEIWPIQAAIEAGGWSDVLSEAAALKANKAHPT